MALVLANRVQETATPNTTVSFTLTGAVSGFQTFAVVGDTNTTYYTATDTAGNWEVGLGQYSTTGPTLTRLTFYASSAGGGPVSFPGNVTVFVTYPSGSSVYLDFSGNVSPLGTIFSGNWQASTVGVAYGGTGVTTSSGPNSVVLRDANENITVNRINQGLQTTTATGGTTTLTAASDFNQALVGTGGHTFRLPDATTLSDTTTFQFNNNATGTLTIENNAGTAVGTVASGGAAGIALLSNATVGGTWDVHAYIPENVTWGTNALALGGTVISGGTWQGGTIQSGYGGTGLTTFTGANNALYSTSASALTAGTLPVVAGGTGLTSFTANGIPYANSTTTLTTGSALTYNGNTLGLYSATAGLSLQTSVNTNQAIITLADADGRTAVFRSPNSGSPNLAQIGTTTNHDLAFLYGNSEQMRLTSTGLGIGTSSPGYKLDVVGSSRIGGDSPYLYIQDTVNPASDVGVYFGAPSAATYAGILTNFASDQLLFRHNGATRMTLDSSGNLGIGTSSPSSFSGYTTVSVNNATNGGIYNILVNGTETARLQAYSGIFNVAAKGAATNLTFETNGAERMRLDASGNLGIGTSSPTEKLHVNNSGDGVIRVTGGASGNAYFLARTSGEFDVFNAANAAIRFSTNGTTRATLDASGNLGLGVTPSAWSGVGPGILELKGNAYVASTSQVLSLVTNAFFNGTNWIYKTSANANRYDTIFGEHRWYTAASGNAGDPITFTQAMTLDASGNLGLGTTSPSSITAGYTTLDIRGSSGGGIRTGKTGAENGLWYTDASQGWFGTVSNIPQVFYTNNTERARIDSSGNFSMAAAGAITGSRINPRTSTTASTATLTPDIQAADQYNLTAQAVGLTVAAPIGTPVDGNKLMFRILDNGSAQTIAWNATYTAIGVTLPTATTANKMVYVGCVYNSTDTRWDVIAVTTQA